MFAPARAHEAVALFERPGEKKREAAAFCSILSPAACGHPACQMRGRAGPSSGTYYFLFRPSIVLIRSRMRSVMGVLETGLFAAALTLGGLPTFLAFFATGLRALAVAFFLTMTFFFAAAFFLTAFGFGDALRFGAAFFFGFAFFTDFAFFILTLPIELYIVNHYMQSPSNGMLIQ
jgi:hypothetical protein